MEPEWYGGTEFSGYVSRSTQDNYSARRWPPGSYRASGRSNNYRGRYFFSCSTNTHTEQNNAVRNGGPVNYSNYPNNYISYLNGGYDSNFGNINFVNFSDSSAAGVAFSPICYSFPYAVPPVTQHAYDTRDGNVYAPTQHQGYSSQIFHSDHPFYESSHAGLHHGNMGTPASNGSLITSRGHPISRGAHLSSRRPRGRPPHRELVHLPQCEQVHASSSTVTTGHAQKYSASNNKTGNSGLGQRNAFYYSVLDKQTLAFNTSNLGDKSRREQLSESLESGSYECIVCCDRIKQDDKIWSCSNCYNYYHLSCIKQWAASSQEGTSWRCPTCQNISSAQPGGYVCFCGKKKNPYFNRKDLPHSCGQVCGKRRPSQSNCSHLCTDLCHPGPCDTCSASVIRKCECGASSQRMRCSKLEPLLCGAICSKPLDCGKHTCSKGCHQEKCEECHEVVLQVCYCGKESREVPCRKETADVDHFSCGETCDKPLECLNHTCQEICHPGTCSSCSNAISAITKCPCGEKLLSELYASQMISPRKDCTDPVPTCGELCGRQLNCGAPGSFHTCQVPCHAGECPPCTLSTPVKCRCGHLHKEIPCVELHTKADEVICKKQCKKMRHCGRHRCGHKCCIDIDHLCTRTCGQLLSCGIHKCTELCHRGNCARCLQSSFDEMSCHCGAAVIYPPVPCGTKPPYCSLTCTRNRRCGHPAGHTCHSEEECPPCTTLVEKLCFGGHKMMRSTPCYLEAISCGELCNKDLECGVHKCERVCHDGPCIAPGASCPQKCSSIRETCGHPCASPCHSGPCKPSPCQEMVTVSCKCGVFTVKLQCSDNEKEFRALTTSLLASQMSHSDSGNPIDLSQLYSLSTKPDKLKRLECVEECAVVARRCKIALALQIESPESRENLGSNCIYSDFLKDFTKKDAAFAELVHAALTDLVFKARNSKQKSRSHSFPPTNGEKRHFIHEYCRHFGCQSESYDEPKRNVVVTATRGFCFLPPVSINIVVQREQGMQKGPNPVWPKQYTSDHKNTMTKLNKQGSQEKPCETAAMEPSEKTTLDKPAIDYFDFEE